MRSGRTREAARCMDFAMPPVHVFVARFCATSTPVLQVSKRLAAHRLESARHLERP
jgi:hypothetical protein